jgi:ssRNA-specific RNase YbeY (16S rRNA maturation enzyme)
MLQPGRIAAQVEAIDELASAYSSTWHGDIYSLIVHAPLHLFNYKQNIQIKVT